MNILQNAHLLQDFISVTDMSESYVTLISMAAMKALLEQNVETFLPDALPFQRGNQNDRWAPILLAYKNSKQRPMRMPLEMRIMGGSDVIMALKRGNSFGTRSAANIWEPFAQLVLDEWMALKDPATGERLKTRPHWAKEWDGHEVDGKPWIESLEAVDYKDERQEFLQTLAETGKKAGI
ncbi:oxidoreductase [Fusarium pseudocircinatum]|uniref:Oxidoreductase n=1 Tax=Fusarium pseudocircinatum TaxID=56676 RepID=A0A8H5UYW5_9HYPO|nr:oxidoreductase [Fusarium pseudocircinatum]